MSRFCHLRGTFGSGVVVALVATALGATAGQAQARSKLPSARAMRAAILPYARQDSRKLATFAFHNENPDFTSGPSVHLPRGTYRIQAVLSLSPHDFTCARQGGGSYFRDGLWNCNPVYQAYYFHRDTNEWAGTGFCGGIYTVLPPRKHSKKLRVQRYIKTRCLNIPDTPPAHELDQYEGPNALRVNPLPDAAPTPFKPAFVKTPATAPDDHPAPPPDLQLPPVPHHEGSKPSSSTARASALHYGCTVYPGTNGWGGPFWDRDYSVWYWVYAEDCRVAGRLLGQRGGAAQNLQWIVTFDYWDGRQAVPWFQWHNPEYSGTGQEIGACFAGSCRGAF